MRVFGGWFLVNCGSFNRALKIFFIVVFHILVDPVELIPVTFNAAEARAFHYKNNR
jgi:hypothetical protein